MFIARHLRHPEKGNADGDRGIFETAGRVWASVLRSNPPKKGLVPHSYAGSAYDTRRLRLVGFVCCPFTAVSIPTKPRR